MDMSNVKTIFDNNVQKNVKKIADASGNILWYKVPSGYRKVEYLESSGTQYIDSGVEAKYSVGIHTKFQCLSVVNAALCGTINNITTGYNSRHHLSPHNGQVGYWYVKNSNINTSTIRDSIDITAINTFYFNPATGVYKVNNSTGSFTALQGTAGSNYGIFGRLSSSLDMQSRPVRIYWFIMMDNNTVVRHFIPVIRTADSKPGMYDLVNDVFYTNAGTGEFTYGGG